VLGGKLNLKVEICIFLSTIANSVNVDNLDVNVQIYVFSLSRLRRGGHLKTGNQFSERLQVLAKTEVALDEFAHIHSDRRMQVFYRNWS
jgi:hypothetical protein